MGTSVYRFNPTGVGTMHYIFWSQWSFTVHPHGRGDNAMSRCRLSSPDGSPPRAWGQSVTIAT